MWEILKGDGLTAGMSPAGWLEGVVPRRREAWYHQFLQARETLEGRSFDAELSCFAADGRGPAGILVVAGNGEARRIVFLAVRGDLRHEGLGRALLQSSVCGAKAQGVRRITASGVSTRNAEAMRLLASVGFRGQTQGGIRMRRTLEHLPPPGRVPDGLELRGLRPGDEAAWVEMKNACFREQGMRSWSAEDFRRAFTDDPRFEYPRVTVVMRGAEAVASATAWEADYGEGPVGLLHWVCVLPSWRRRGLGREVSVRAMRELAARGYADAWLNTSWKREAAVGLYVRLGFHVHREPVSYVLHLRAEAT